MNLWRSSATWGCLARPLTILGWVISLAQRAVVSLGRIEEILSTVPAATVPVQTEVFVPAVAPAAREQPLIVFEAVDFAYNGRPILHGINLQGSTWRAGCHHRTKWRGKEHHRASHPTFV